MKTSQHYRYRKTALFAATVFFVSLSHGQAARADEAKTLGTVVVTANRVEQPANETLAAVTVLTRADIERSQAPDLISLLARQPGIDQVRTGGPGSLSTINTRGSNSNHTLVLIDGLRVNTAVQGLFDFAHLPLAQIERIEIVRGPRAALWGSDAIGGVIQIFTRNNAKPYFEARAGSYGHAGIDAGFAVNHDDLHFSAGAGSDYQIGFSATNPDAGQYVYDADKDGYRNTHANVQLSDSLGSQVLSFSARAANARTEYDQGVSQIRDRQFGIKLSGELRTGWSHELLLGYNSDTVDSVEPFYNYGFASTRTSLDWLNHIALNDHQQLQVGINASRESGRSTTLSATDYNFDRRNTGLFAAWSGQFDTQRLELSVRHDNNSQFGGTTTANAAWGWQVSNALRLRASWGQGFRAPNFNELYYPGFFGYYKGNANLNPERSASAEVGLDWQMGEGQTLGLSAYRTRVRDLIAFQGVLNQAINISHAHLDGVEADYHYAQGAWSFAANASWQRTENADPASVDFGKALLRRAPRKAHASLDYRFDCGLTLGWDVDALSARPDLDFNVYPAERIDLGGYTLLSVRAALPLAGGWQLEARIENLGDRDYALARGYNTPGRSGTLGLRWEGQ